MSTMKAVKISILLTNTIFVCSLNSDVIKNLPGLPEQPNFNHYSGYLNGYFEGHHLHYWFVESQRNATEDPVVLWMNGGPGCSSLTGLLTEHGPLIAQKDGRSLKYNDYSWNKVANILYLEAPVGVGFSFSKNKSDYRTNDNRTTIDNFYALKSFFIKYPHLLKNDFYVTGESYGGMYVPLLTEMILDSPSNINLKGFAIGNGFLDAAMNDISLYFYYYYHGFIGQSEMKSLTTFCCNSSYNMKECNTNNEGCEKVLQGIRIGRVNMYNVYEKCYPTNSSHSTMSMLEAEANHIESLKRLKPVIPCIDMAYVSSYLNQPIVRSALHIPDHLSDISWDVCSAFVNQEYKRLYSSMRQQVLKILSFSVRGMIYNGDFDTACNFLGDEWFVDSLGLPVKSTKMKYYEYDNQVAGYSKSYKMINFVTVKAAGHMVPTDKPQVALKIFNNFLQNRPL